MVSISNREGLEHTKKKKWVVAAIDMMKEGKSISYIRKHIQENIPDISKSYLDSITHNANAHIANEHLSSRRQVTSLHIARYNKEINRLLQVKEITTSPKTLAKTRKAKIEAYLECLDVMFQKESLLQFHRKDFEIEINTEEEIEIKEKKFSYDISKLSLTEQVELYELIKQAKKNENEISGIINNARSNEVTEDIEVEVIEEKPNVESIKRIEQKVEDTPAKDLNEVSDKIINTYKEIIKNKFKAIGADLNNEKETIQNG